MGTIDSPKKRTDIFDLFAFLLFTASKSNLSVCFLGESTARQSVFWFYLTNERDCYLLQSLNLKLKVFERKYVHSANLGAKRFLTCGSWLLWKSWFRRYLTMRKLCGNFERAILACSKLCHFSCKLLCSTGNTLFKLNSLSQFYCQGLFFTFPHSYIMGTI